MCPGAGIQLVAGADFHPMDLHGQGGATGDEKQVPVGVVGVGEHGAPARA